MDEVLTGVMEGDQQVGAAGPPARGCASLDDGEGPQARSGDLLKHAASGVDDEHQGRGLPHAEQPGQTRCTGQRCWREVGDSVYAPFFFARVKLHGVRRAHPVVKI